MRAAGGVRGRPLTRSRLGQPAIVPSPAPLPPADVRTALADAVRLAALDATDIRSRARGSALDPIVRLAARALRVPVAQINVLTADQQVPVAACALGGRAQAEWEVPVGLDASYCQHVVASDRALLVEDARVHPLVRGSRATVEAGIVSYAGVPLRAPAALGPGLAGRVIGTVCVVDFAPRRWTDEDLALLTDLADAVRAELEVRTEAARLAAREVADVASAAIGRANAALAESEARLRTLADAMPQLAWMADDTGAIVWFNRRWFEYTGTTLDAVRGTGWAAVHHPEHVERVVTRYRAAIAAREPWEDTFPLRARDGSYRWFLARAVPVCDPVDATTRWLGTSTDITERIAADAERERLLRAAEEARAVAEQANRAKSQFLATMSHELRTPLNAIGGYAELLSMGLRGPVTEAQLEDLARIRRSQQHLLGVITEILSFARLEGSAVRYDLEDVPVAAALQDVATMLLPQASLKGLGFRVDACPTAAAARADREKLRQVLVNLVGNAVKFTRAPGQVRLSCSADAEHVRLHVRDTGIGIPPEKLERVFEPFVQVDSSLTRTAGGTGLGLAIARELALGMGGDLTAESTPGSGSTFTVTLPRAADVADARDGDGADVDGGAALADLEGEARALLAGADGLHAVLRFLNARTAHRYTGLYRFDGSTLRNVALFDREEPSVRRGSDAPMRETYCSIVGATEGTFALADARQDARVAAHPARDAVVSYCGALVRDGDGTPLGTLCSFDVEPRQVPAREIPLLEGVAPLLAQTLRASASPGADAARDAGAPDAAAPALATAPREA